MKKLSLKKANKTPDGRLLKIDCTGQNTCAFLQDSNSSIAQPQKKFQEPHPSTEAHIKEILKYLDGHLWCAQSSLFENLSKQCHHPCHHMRQVCHCCASQLFLAQLETAVSPVERHKHSLPLQYL
jgi:hypothetical protein